MRPADSLGVDGSPDVVTAEPSSQPRSYLLKIPPCLATINMSTNNCDYVQEAWHLKVEHTANLS